MPNRRVVVALSFLLTVLPFTNLALRAQSVTFRGLITTAAGGNSFGTPCNGLASNTQLGYPSGSAVDAAGNLYIADTSNERVCKVDPSGNVMIVAGGTATVCSAATDSIGDGCPGTGAVLLAPEGLALDTTGNLYIADQGNNRVRKLSANTQLITTVAGTGTSCTSPVPGCGDGGQATSALLNAPVGVALDSTGNLYIAGQQEYRVRKVDTTGVITTVAGTGVSGFSGDGGSATSAKLGTLCGVSLDRTGNLYITDCDDNYRVRKVDGSGTITTVAGNGNYSSTGDGGQATSASLYPTSVVFDSYGNMIIGDFAGQRIRKVDASGIITTVAGTGTSGYSGDKGPAALAKLHNPMGLSSDTRGNTYLADMMNHALRELQLYSVNFGLINVGSTGPTYSFGFNFNSSVTVGSVAVLTQGIAGKDFQAASGGTCAAGAYTNGGSCTVNVTFNPLAPGLRSGAVVLYDNSTPANLLVTLYIYGTGTGPMVGFGPGIISSVAGNGNGCGSSTSPCGDGGPATSAQLGINGNLNPGVAFDGAGNLFFPDLNRIRVICAASSGFCAGKTVGDIYSVVGTGDAGYNGDNIAATIASLYYPNGVAIDGAGNIYISDSWHYRIRKVDASTGIITTVAGNGNPWWGGDNVPATSSTVTPNSIAVDSIGNLYIADSTQGSEVRKVDVNGIITTIAGGPNWSGYNGDNIPASSAQVNSVLGVAVDSAGNLYIADNGNGRVRKVDLSGIITTVAGTGNSTFNGDNIAATTANINPKGVVLDAAGDLYITDATNGRVRKVDTSGIITTVTGTGRNGSYNGENIPANTANVVPAGGLTLDAVGNLYVPDGNSNRVRKVDLADPPVLAFSNTNVGSSSAAQDVTVENLGNAQLNISKITNSTIFPLQGPDTSCSSSGQLLNGGASCVLGFEFVPSSAGVYSLAPAALLTDNALNGSASQQIYAGGTSVASVPLVTTTAITSITATTASGGGNVTSDGGATVTARGVCWGVSTNPSLTNTCTTNGTGTGTFASAVTGLTGNTAYHVRAYATNSAGTTYGADVAFTTPLPTGYSFTNTAVGSSSSQTVTLLFSNAGTLSSIGVVTQGAPNLDFQQAAGGTCTIGTSYAAGATCTVNVTFTPLDPGLRMGAVVLADASGTTLATSYLQGIGTGPLIGFGPGVQTTIATDLSDASALTVDAAGNVYILDRFNYRAVKVSAAGVETVIATGLNNSPYGIAVDGAGNVYLGQAGYASTVIKVPANGGAVSTYVTGVSPLGLATDGAGNLYIVDTHTGEIVKVAPDGTKTTIPCVQAWCSGSTFYQAYADVVDSAGNIYIAGGANGNGYVLKVSPDGLTQTVVGTTGLGDARGVAVDTAGDVYVADEVHQMVLKVPVDGSAQSTVGTGLAWPGGVAVDGTGNVYILNANNKAFKVDVSDPPTLTFPNTNAGSTSAAQDVTAENLGNAQLAITSLTNSSFFPAHGSDTSCTLGTGLNEILNPGAGCILGIEFAPTAGGAYSLVPAAVFADNNMNGSAWQQIYASGTGVAVTTIPTVTTTAITSITATTASGGGGVTSDGGASVTARGVCWAITTNPSTLNTCTHDGTGAGTFTSAITGLTASTGYHVRAYATNSVGTAYGSDVAFTTAPPPVTASPTLSLASGSYVGPQTVTLSDTTPGAVIYYTTDGSTPTTSSTQYTGAITVSATTTINSIAIASGYAVSAMSSATYTITPACTTQSVAFQGIISTIASFGATFWDAAVDGAGNIYIADNQAQLLKVTPAGVQTWVSTAHTVSSLAVDSAGNIYYSDYGGSQVYKLATDGTQTAVGSGYNQPRGVAVDISGNVYVADTYNNRVVKVTPGGTQTVFLTGVTYPQAVAVDAAGNVYVADPGNKRVVKVTAGGTQSSIGSGLAGPSGVAVDASGNVYIGDGSAGSAVLIKVTPGGVQTAVGQGSTSALRLVVDRGGNAYFGGYGGYSVFKLQLSSVNFGYINVGASGPATALNFALNGCKVGGAAGLTLGASGKDFQAAAVPAACGTTGQTACGVNVTFAPLAAGMRNGAIVLYDTSSPANALLTLYISGTGVGPEIAFGPGIISTVAGNGTQGYGGDSGPATSAGLQLPIGVALDGAGNLYIGDDYNSRVRKVDAGTGLITTVAGTGTAGYGGDSGAATSAQLHNPLGVAVDGAGNLYIVDNGNQRIRKVTAGGAISTVAGNGTAGYGGDGGPATSAQVSSPSGVAVDSVGNLYIADNGNNRIRKVDAITGIITTVAGTGTAGYSGDGGPATSAQLNWPNTVAVDGAGNLYFADYKNYRVRKVDASGIITTLAGTGTSGFSGDGGAAVSAQMADMGNMAVDSAGNLYVTDSGNNRIRKITPAGVITTVAGDGTAGFSGDSGPATSAELSWANGLALDGAGNLYLGDYYNNRVRKIDVSDPPALAFPNTNVGSTSAAQDVAVENLGNAQLNITQISGLTAPFNLLGADTSCSASSQQLTPSASCILGVEFAPVAVGSNSGSIVLTDNSLNISNATQTLNLTGTGRTAACSWSNPVNGNWSDGTKWDCGHTPGASDHATVAVNGTYTVTLDISPTINGFVLGGTSGTETVSGSGQTLTINAASSIGTLGVMNLTNSAVSGTGGLTNQGTLNLVNSTVNAALNNAGTVNSISGGNGSGNNLSAISGAFTTQSGSLLHVDGNFTSTVLTVANGFTNNGTIELTSSGPCCGGSYNSTLAVTTGTLVNGPSGAINSLTGGGLGSRYLTAALNNQGTVTTSFPLTINQASATHTSSGTINVNANLTMNQSGTSPSFTHTGTTTIASGNTLTVNGGTVNLNAGAVAGAGTFALSSGTANVSASPTVHTINLSSSTANGPGTLTILAGNILNLLSSTVTAALNNAGTVNSISGGNGSGDNLTAISGAFTTQSGSLLHVDGNFTSTVVTVANGFTNNGTIELTSSGPCCGGTYNSTLAVTTGTLTNGPGGAINSLSGGGLGSRYLTAALNNQGAVTTSYPMTINQASATHTSSGTINVNANLTMNQSGTSPSFANTGTINISSGNTLTVNNGTVNLSSGSVTGAGTLALSTVIAGVTTSPTVHTINLSSSTANGPGTLTILAGNILNLLNSTVTVALNNAGTVNSISGGNGSGDNLSAISGALTTQGASLLHVDANFTSTVLTVANGFTNNGTIELTSSGPCCGGSYNSTLAVTTGTLVNGATGAINSLTGGGLGSRYLTAAINNQGSITVSWPLTINQTSATHTNSGTINANANLTVSQSGTSPSFTNNSGTVSIANGSTFTVSGGALELNGGSVGGLGALALSGTIADLRISPSVGSFSMSATSALGMFIGGTTAGSQYSQLGVSGAASLAGTLNVSLINGFTPAAGNAFTLLTYGSGTGSFGTSNLPIAPAGSNWTLTKGATAVTLVAQAIQTVPTVTTTAITGITAATATGGGSVTADGGATVTARGVCWSTSANPTTANSCTTDGMGTGTFASSIAGLTANTAYHVRAYATNSLGTAYGADVAFTTLPPAGYSFTNTGVGSSGTQTVTLQFTTAGTLNSIGVLTQGAPNLDFLQASGGTCAIGTAYAAGATCTVNVTFTPLDPGLRTGAVVLSATGGVALATSYLQGIGNAPAIGFGPGIISTVAGNGTACANSSTGTCGDGAAATSAQLNSPANAALDGAGDLYIADDYNHRIRKVDTSGNITTVAGTGTAGYNGDGIAATSAQLNDPTSVIVDGAGNLYIADYYNSRIRKVDATGKITTVAGTGTAGYNGDNIPAVTAQLNKASSLMMDGAGNLYIGDYVNNRVRKVDASGNITTIAGTGTAGFSGDNGLATSATLNFPEGIAMDIAGNLYIGDEGNYRVRKIDTSGIITTVAGTGTAGYNGDNILATSAQIYSVTGVAVDVAGDLYLADNSSRVRKVNPTTGLITTAAGNGTAGYSGDNVAATSTEINNVSGVMVDGSGNLYISDSLNNRIRKVDVSDPPSLTFPDTYVGSSSPAQDVIVEDLGNAQLSISRIGWSANFNLQGADTSCGTSGQLLNAGASCILGIEYAPLSVGEGPNYGSFALTDNALNVTSATQRIPVSGLALASTTVPTVTTTAITSIAQTTASGGGNVTADGGATVTARGVCWSTSANPTTANSCTNDGTGTGVFTSSIAGLTASTSYHVRAYAINSAGTAYGVDVAFTTAAPLVPQATLNPNPLAFPSTLVGTAATAQPMTLSNPGSGALTISSISVTGTNASSFGQTNNCGTSLAAGGTCTITVTFTPAAAGSLSAAVSVADNATGSPQTAVITGTGTQPQATLSPNPLAFPSTLVGTAATPLPMTLSNPGTAALTISSISVTGTNATSFGQTNNCGASLAAGGTCTITVTFTPATAASLSAAISIADNATGSPQSAVVTGTGTAPLIPQAVLSPNPLAFPSTNVGTAATPLPMTLSNPGNAPLAISNICVAGANASSFSQSNTCGTSLAAGGTCTISVTFTPAAAGSLAATISVTDNAVGSPHSAAVTGTGSTATYVVNATTPTASVQPGAVAQFNIMVAPLGGSFNNMVTLSATGLPAGAKYSFQPAAVMPGSAGAPSVLSIQTSSGLARVNSQSRRQNTLPMLALLAGVPLLGLAGHLRRLRGSHRRSMLLCLAVLAALPIVAISGCGGGYFGPPPQTYTVTVTGTSGSLQQTTTVSLTVQ